MTELSLTEYLFQFPYFFDFRNLISVFIYFHKAFRDFLS